MGKLFELRIQQFSRFPQHIPHNKYSEIVYGETFLKYS
jgi:hypothetical protein